MFFFEIFNSQKIKKIKEKLPDFYKWSKQVAKNIEGYFTKLFSYLACSPIWLNLSRNHHNIGYNTKLPRKNIGSNRVFSFIFSKESS